MGKRTVAARQLLTRAARAALRPPLAGARWAADQVPEGLLIGGAAAVAYGAWQVFHPAGWIVGGLLAVIAGWRLGRPVPEVKRG